MERLAALFVGKPLHIAAVAAVFFLGFIALRTTRFGASRHGLLVAAVGWLLYAAWEWLVQVRSPEANIRVDLLVIWPALSILSGWAIFRLLRPRG